MQKDSGTHMHGLPVYVKEGLPFGRDLSLEFQKTLQILTYVFDWLYFTQCLTSFYSFDPPSLSLCTILDSISSIYMILFW